MSTKFVYTYKFTGFTKSPYWDPFRVNDENNGLVFLDEKITNNWHRLTLRKRIDSYFESTENKELFLINNAIEIYRILPYINSDRIIGRFIYKHHKRYILKKFILYILCLTKNNNNVKSIDNYFIFVKIKQFLLK